MSHPMRSYVPSPPEVPPADWPPQNFLPQQQQHQPHPSFQPAVHSGFHQQSFSFGPTTVQPTGQLYPSYMLGPSPLDVTKPPSNLPQNLIHTPVTLVDSHHPSSFLPTVNWPFATFPQHNPALMDLHSYHQNQYSLQKRPSLSTESVKHRRTRSGCFTCRNRRVKCDETRPICDRCRKGNRDCSYPDPPVPKSKKGHVTSPGGPDSVEKERSRAAASKPGDLNVTEGGDSPSPSPPPSASNDGYINDESDLGSLGSAETSQFLEPILDDPAEDEDYDCLSSRPSLQLDIQPQSPLGEVLSCATPLNTNSTPVSAYFPPATRNADISTEWELNANADQILAGLGKFQPGSLSFSSPPDLFSGDRVATVQYYLQFHRHHLSYFHYGVRQDSDNFLKTQFLDLAISNRHLLYAVLAYSAYFHSIILGGPDIAVFATFQNLALRALRESMNSSSGPSVATLLCVLQLAKLEDVTGTWTTLAHHRQAAKWMIANWFDFDAVQAPAFAFAIRVFFNIDMAVGTILGDMSCLDMRWHNAMREASRIKLPIGETDYDTIYSETYSSLRWCTSEIMRCLNEVLQQSGSSEDGLVSRLEVLEKKVAELPGLMRPNLLDPSFLESPLVPDPAFCPATPFGPRLRLFLGPLYRTNVLLTDIWTLSLVFNYQMLLITNKLADGERTGHIKSRLRSKLVHLMVRCCRLFESIYSHGLSHRPPGVLVALGPGVNTVAIMMPITLQTLGQISVHTLLQNCPELDYHHPQLASLLGYELSPEAGSYPVTSQKGDIVRWLCEKLALLEKAGHHLPSSTRAALRSGFNLPDIDDLIDECVNLSHSRHPDSQMIAPIQTIGDSPTNARSRTITGTAGAGPGIGAGGEQFRLTLEVPATSVSVTMSPCSGGTLSPSSSPGYTTSPAIGMGASMGAGMDISRIVSQELRAYVRNRANRAVATTNTSVDGDGGGGSLMGHGHSKEPGPSGQGRGFGQDRAHDRSSSSSLTPTPAAASGLDRELSRSESG